MGTYNSFNKLFMGPTETPKQPSQRVQTDTDRQSCQYTKNKHMYNGRRLFHSPIDFDEETEAQEEKPLAQGYTPGRQRQDLNPGPREPFHCTAPRKAGADHVPLPTRAPPSRLEFSRLLVLLGVGVTLRCTQIISPRAKEVSLS